jgi:hypothetical protein
MKKNNQAITLATTQDEKTQYQRTPDQEKINNFQDFIEQT